MSDSTSAILTKKMDIEELINNVSYFQEASLELRTDYFNVHLLRKERT